MVSIFKTSVPNVTDSCLPTLVSQLPTSSRHELKVNSQDTLTIFSSHRQLLSESTWRLTVCSIWTAFTTVPKHFGIHKKFENQYLGVVNIYPPLGLLMGFYSFFFCPRNYCKS